MQSNSGIIGSDYLEILESHLGTSYTSILCFLLYLWAVGDARQTHGALIIKVASNVSE